MKVVVQRVISSSVSVNNNVVGKSDYGMMLLVGFTHDDTADKVLKMIDKIINLRIFNDENHIMNKSIFEIGGNILSISQFTLYADTKKGNRPSYINSMNKDSAIKMYDFFNQELSKYVKVEIGQFGGDMKVSLINDGPVTIILEI